MLQSDLDGNISGRGTDGIVLFWETFWISGYMEIFLFGLPSRWVYGDFFI